ncbi:unnamed protein product [Brugia timori]|uniref:Uncharacterized protein n=1 Tax=Brugia timori TaxID=42155 RepID=A0A0R3R3L9_9BILA|nr:unnamed protein product [Brugia timori]
MFIIVVSSYTITPYYHYHNYHYFVDISTCDLLTYAIGITDFFTQNCKHIRFQVSKQKLTDNGVSYWKLLEECIQLHCNLSNLSS